MKERLFRFFIAGTALVSSALGLAGRTLGADPKIDLPSPGQIETGNFGSSLPQTIETVFNFIIAIAGIVFVILLIVGGIQYLTAAGNEEATGKAKKLLIDSIIGLVIVLAAWAIGRFVLAQFGYNLT